MRTLLCAERRLTVETLGAALALRGHHVVGLATDPARAATLAAHRHPEVCVLELAPRGAAGLATVAALVAAGCRVVVLSPRVDRATVRAVQAAGAAALVGRGERLEDLLLVLDRLAAGALHVPVNVSATGSHEPPADAEHDVLRFLTPRERETLERIADGQSTREIARSMHVEYSTARTHVQNVLTKLGVRTQLQAAALAARAGVAAPLDPADAGRRCLAAGS